MTANSTTLKRATMRAIFRRHPGSQAELARELVMSPVSVSLWLKGKFPSKRLAEAIPAKAQALLDLENAEQGARRGV